MKQMPDRVQIAEFGPALVVDIPAKARVEMIESLVDAGISRIHAGTVADGKAVIPNLIHIDPPQHEEVKFSATTHVITDLDNARASGFRHVDVLVPVHEEYSRETLNHSLSELMKQVIMIASRAQEYGLIISGRILSSFGYREANDVEMQTIGEITKTLLDLGVQDIVLDDSMIQLVLQIPSWYGRL
jgi:isopropylmalate/homocitrate/citramalate synthase